MKRTLVASLLALATAFSLHAQDGEWKSLFNGKDFTGWAQHSGTAKYRVEDGCVVGETVLGTGNSFMCTTKEYANFILEFEFKVPAGMNSGVQFRSQFYDKETEVVINDKPKKFPADRVHGYQFEIDPSARAYTGGVYDEARRGWLNDLKNNEAARKAFKDGEWNKGRIECKGDSIKTFINDVPAADLKDSLTPKGIIALQVHGIGKNGKPGSEIRWKNIRLQELP